ncbi:AAA family ATPase [Solirubrobacter ginsenosidimutans]|uniref:AAA family ATPase n=1 Tax=Solirubrobacter ginsenosidimutans TaxID=490573 RepID=A0A9X3RXS7_9ACTN|nr:LuxR family transcriptional regulator [Solirubrobacter ginsenosidimutans]MDA0158865.1 AAA family ATPase [Solirubrobacter ginsenosidimutans]
MPSARGLGFVGRTRERERLDATLAPTRDGHSAVLVIRGEPGIGKTALLRYAARQASGLRTIEVEGVQAEMELAFAGIHRLCLPLLDKLETLAPPQQNAIEVALGVAAGDPPDRFLVAVAVLNLLCTTADTRPILCLVDDAQWLDAASVQTFGFVARRLAAEPVAMVFTLREPITTTALHGLPDLQLHGLQEPDARALLSRAVPGRLDDRVRDRIIAETGGNPLGLMELSQRMSPSERAAGFAPPAASDLPSRLEERYLRRVAELPETARRLILLAAAEPLGEAALLWRAAERLSIAPDALAPATEAGLLEIQERIRFSHPLVRSAVYRAASPEELRTAHEALAEASDSELDADRRAWHLALAAAGPDEGVAAALEHSAGRAQGRGGLAAAAALLERATVLTPDPALQAGRALAAAGVSLQAGAFDATQRLLVMAETGPLDPFQRALVGFLRGNIAVASVRDSGAAATVMLDAARELEAFDLETARRAYLTGWQAAIAAGYLGGADVIVEICRAVRRLPALPPDPHALDVLLDGLTLLTTDGRAAATPVLRRAASALVELPESDVLRWGVAAPTASNAIWDADGATAIAERMTRIVRDAAALAVLPTHLSGLAMDRAWSGDLAAARALIAESDSVAAATGSRIPPFAAVRLGALRGRLSEASASIQAAIAHAEANGQGTSAQFAHWSAAVLYNGLARYEEALAAAQEATANAIDPFQSMWPLPELVEAAVRAGEPELAHEALERLVETTQPAGTDFALGIEARSRALVSDGAAAEALYLEAIERLSRTRLRPELARGQLVFGEWLRQQGRTADAREQLRAAEDLFAAIGMEAFSQRARAELVRAGATVRSSPVEAHQQLTPQEDQIAHLARDGLTNAQIGDQLFISRRTVEWHLRKVFAKLAIDSRNGLNAALPRAE